MPNPVAPFAVNPAVISSIAISYTNRRLIADLVMPRVAVGTSEFKYPVMNMADSFTVPDTKIGRKSRPNQVETTGTLVPGTVYPYGLDDIVPQSDIDKAAPGVDPINVQTEFVTNLVALDREIRVANAVFNPANHNNKVTLSGTSQWSDYANSDPVSAIMGGLDTAIMRPNTMVIGRLAFSKLSMHPKICKAIFGNNTDAGIVTREQLAQLLELDQVLVGEGFVNTAKRGQAANMQRVWGKNAAFLYSELPQMSENATTWGFTAQFGDRFADSWFDKNAGGLGGGHIVRVGEEVNEVVCAPDLSYFFQNVVA